MTEPETNIRLTIAEVLDSPWLQTFVPDESMQDVMEQEPIVLNEVKAYRQKSIENHQRYKKLFKLIFENCILIQILSRFFLFNLN